MPASIGVARPVAEEYSLVVPFKIVTRAGLLSLFTTTTVFGTPVDVTLSELALEMFFPADAETAETVRRLAGQGDPGQRLTEAAE
jgi:MmyB-like transcription regulator ligand binding domain